MEERAAAEQAREKKDDRYVMVRWYIDDSVLPPDRRSAATSGKGFVGIRLDVANHGYDQVILRRTHIMLTVDGQPFGQPMPGALEELPDGIVANGTKVTGGLAFEVPDLSARFSLDLRPTAPGDCQVRYGEAR
jgi:hypothetical protein